MKGGNKLSINLVKVTFNIIKNITKLKMNSNDKVINDFHFFQNEILKDLKKMESKFNDKVTQINNAIGEQKLKTETKIQDFISRLDLLTNQIQEKRASEDPLNIIQPIKEKMEESISKLETKTFLLQKDIDNACFRYDKIIYNNLNVPGIIGSSCPYETLRPFIEFVNKKMTELLKAKDKQILDLKKYKEKLETIISNNNKQLDTSQKQINEYFKNGLKQCDTNCVERINVVEKRIEALRIENGEFSYNLKKRSEELKIEWDKLDMVDKNLNKRYTEEVAKFDEIIDKIGKKVDKYKDELNLIKVRFTELSEFIKDIRFRSNIHNTFQERKQYREMSYKIDFTKKQRLKQGEGEDKERLEEKDKINLDYLAPFDYYSNFGINSYVKKDDEVIKEEDNNNNVNNNDVSNNDVINNNINDKINSEKKIDENKIDDNKKSTECKIIENYMKMPNNNLVRNDNKLRTYNVIKINKNNLNEGIINFIPESKKRNNFLYGFNKSQKNLDINKIILNSSEKNPIKNIKNNNNDLSNTNVKKINDTSLNNNKNNRKINNIKNFDKQEIKNIPNFKENAKINELILSINLKKNQNNNITTSNNNLGQSSYLLMKKKIEEMQTIKKIYGSNNYKYRNLSSPPSLKYEQKNAKIKRKHSYKLNKFNVLSNKDFKKGNIEDLYYNQIKTDKINEISNASSKLLLRSNQDDKHYYKTIYKKMYPILSDNQRLINSSLNDKNSIQSSFIESNQHFSNNNNNFVEGDLYY